MKLKLKWWCVIIYLLVVNILYAQKKGTKFPYLSLIQNELIKQKKDIKSDDIKELYIEKEFLDKKTSVQHIYVGQSVQGVKIKDVVSSLAIRNGAVVYFANSFLSDLSSRVNTLSPTITPQAAIEIVVRRFNLGNLSNSKALNSNNNEYLFDKGSISQNHIPVNLRLVNLNDKLVLSWTVEIYTLDSKNLWSVVVDATTGDIIIIKDLVLKCDFGIPNAKHNHSNKKYQHEDNFTLFKRSNTSIVSGAQYNIFPYPLESPNHGSRQIVIDPSSSASPFGWHDIDGIEGAEFTNTRGNNVFAYEDSANQNSPGFSPDGGLALNFDFTLDFNQPANTNTPSAQNQSSLITNLFYWNNIMHDVWYNYGFDEAAGNFQENNYGNGGVGGDSVNAEASDGSGTNNANFATPSDGNNPRMQMYLFGSSGQRTTSLRINTPAGLAGNYAAVLANFGGSLNSDLTADLVLVNDGSSSPSFGCNSIVNNLTGKIAVIDRGTCNFSVKAYNAQNAGAIAVIVVNNVAGDPIAMGNGTNGNLVTIPCVMISQSDGNLIKSALPSVNGTLIAATTSLPRDSSFDNGIVAHEYGHGISSRLSSLNNQEQMGEGWSDWFALMMTITPGDVASKRRGIGTFAAFQPTTGNGIRSYPYSTDMSINPFTYSDIATESVPHGVGSVWATMLWDLTWAMIDQYGYSSDIYNGNAGNNMAMHLVIEGLKLQPYNPGFIDGRDAILAADEILYNGQNSCLIWNVFARRGLGASASQGSNNSVTDGVEAYDIPESFVTGSIQRNYCGTDELTINFSNLRNSEISQIEYTLTIDGDNSNKTEIVNVSSCESTGISVDLSNLSKGTHLITFTGTNPVSAPKSFLINKNDNGTENVINTFENNTDVLVAFDLNSSSSTWQRGLAAGSTLSNAVAGGSKVYGTNLSGIHGDGGTYYLVSQCYNLSNLENTIVKFDMAFDIENDFDVMYMEYSIDNGLNWSVLGTANDIDWYNNNTLANNSCVNCIGNQWTGEADNPSTHSAGGINGAMHNYKHSLSAFDARGSAETNILFRFKYQSDAGFANEGVILDNFVIEGTPTNLAISGNEFKNLGIYPNPTNSLITIESSDVLENVTIKIYDLTGRQLNQKVDLNSINENKMTLDFSSLANGTYFITIMNDIFQSTRQIIKN